MACNLNINGENIEEIEIYHIEVVLHL